MEDRRYFGDDRNSIIEGGNEGSSQRDLVEEYWDEREGDVDWVERQRESTEEFVEDWERANAGLPEQIEVVPKDSQEIQKLREALRKAEAMNKGGIKTVYTAPSVTPPLTINKVTGEITPAYNITLNKDVGFGGLKPSLGGYSGTELGRLIIEPVANAGERQILNAIRQLRSQGSWSIEDLMQRLNDPSMAEQLANAMNTDVGIVTNVFKKVLSTGISGVLMALTGNFPLAAMGYFASDRVLGQPSGVPFSGYPGLGTFDGVPVLPMGLSVPDGLPNEIFGDFRFVCCDLLSMKWYPTDEIRPLNYQGGQYRWFCLDRVDGRVYQANWIKKPVIYV